MTITDVRILLAARNDKGVLAYVQIVLDNALVIRDLRILNTRNGGTMVVMPSRKLTDHCNQCNGKNFLTAKYCCECGVPLERVNPREVLHSDVAFPITQAFRRYLEERVREAYESTLWRNSGNICNTEATYNTTVESITERHEDQAG